MILDVPSKCTPIHGYMTGWIAKTQQERLRHLIENTKEEQESMLLNTIESFIQHNQTSYITADSSTSGNNDLLLHVAYVGERNLSISSIDPEVLARPKIDSNKVAMDADDNGGLNSGYIGLTVAAAFLIIIAVLIGAGLVHRQRRRNRQHDEPEMHLAQQEEGQVSAVPLSSPFSTPSENTRAKGLFGLSRGDKNDNFLEGAFPTVARDDSIVASGGGSFASPPISPPTSQLDSDCDDESIPPPQDENVRSSNLFGLSTGNRSDAILEGEQPTLTQQDSSIPPMSPTLQQLDDGAADDDETQDSSLPPPQDENVRSNNLFGLNPGDRSDDMVSPSISQSDTLVASGANPLYDSVPMMPVDDGSDDEDEPQRRLGEMV